MTLSIPGRPGYTDFTLLVHDNRIMANQLHDLANTAHCVGIPVANNPNLAAAYIHADILHARRLPAETFDRVCAGCAACSLHTQDNFRRHVNSLAHVL
jgi:hypothetical protein